MVAVGDRAKARLDERDHILDQITAELRGVLAGLRLQIRRDAVAERHDDNEWFHPATRTKVVKNEIHAPRGPRGCSRSCSASIRSSRPDCSDRSCGRRRL